MAGVGGVSAKDKQLDALRDAESGPNAVTTANVLQQVQKDTGFRHQTAIRGDDRTLDELIDDQKGWHENVAGLVALAVKLAEGAELSGAAHALGHVVGGGAATGEAVAVGSAGGAAFAIAAPLVGYGAMVYEVAEAGEKGRAQAEALYRDQTHVAMLLALKLPAGFTSREIKKYPLATQEGHDGTVSKLTTTLQNKDKGLLPLLQLHADQGMMAAKDAFDEPVAPGDYLKTHPELAKRYADDPAFKAGFDAMVWAHSNGASAYEAACSDLAPRTTDYAAHQVPVRA
jgi:hypothetical protein